MDYQKLFEELKIWLDLAPDAKLQAAYQYGVQADELAQLVIKKIKTATTSAYDLYEKDEPLPQAGGYDLILDSKDQLVALIQVDQVQIVPYLEVDEDHAFREGEGDRTLAYWRKAHDAFFKEDYALAGKVFDPQTAKIVLEKFHLVVNLTENKLVPIYQINK
ncbi:ASCH domain-containing protein [Ligilactobacillus agilis]|uniref:ASCH domain-containing protein n=1 Tax=Ligilactobacillus agilis TaxID=1601 RepID=UPI0025A3943B|nr:ASCH domain-containing protein [Ligilactobacillus agilis]MDM8279813.1 ASCH domain-containing protein [Ligilactobacillus agilis]